MRPFPCRFCDKTFKSKLTQRQHERIHTGECFSIRAQNIVITLFLFSRQVNVHISVLIVQKPSAKKCIWLTTSGCTLVKSRLCVPTVIKLLPTRTIWWFTSKSIQVTRINAVFVVKVSGHFINIAQMKQHFLYLKKNIDINFSFPDHCQVAPSRKYSHSAEYSCHRWSGWRNDWRNFVAVFLFISKSACQLSTIPFAVAESSWRDIFFFVSSLTKSCLLLIKPLWFVANYNGFNKDSIQMIKYFQTKTLEFSYKKDSKLVFSCFKSSS